MMSKKGKTIQKISIFAALVMLIVMALGVSVMADTSVVVVGDTCYTHGDIIEDGKVDKNDAIYLLYHSVFGELAFPLSNYEKDGEIVGIDAIRLLDYIGKEETVHAYKDPVWQWTEDGTAKAVFTCACGKGDVLVKDAEVKSTSTEANCITEGITVYEAEAKLTETLVYTAQKTVQTAPATGIHTFDSNIACIDRTCTICNHVEVADAHAYKVVQTTTATCTEAATITYACEACGEAEYTVEDGLAAGHTFEVSEKHVNGCEYKELFTCKDCNESVDGETYYKHEAVASITKEATCNQKGEKTYTCKTCNTVTKVEEMDKVADAHTWVMKDGTDLENDTVIEYTCVCEATRTAINAAAKEKVEVTSQALKENEVDLNGTSLKLDEETANQLTGTVEITAEEKTASDLKVELTDEQKEQIGDNPVYDFSMKDDNGAVTNFDGSITISLPYELQEGDDADCIDVWFIDEDGTITIQEGTYANGQVTFTAKHFSYYTVTRLTPAQRCEKYGHSDTTRVVAAACTEDGYTLHVCARCTETWKTDEVKAAGHAYVENTTNATCTEDGKTVVTCENCNYKKTTKLPATGHTWKETTEKATCKEAKKVSVGCENCDKTKEIVLAQLKHETEVTSVSATCISNAYDITTCKNCDYEVKEDTAPATGHDYASEWKWDKEALTAELVFTCKVCKDEVVREGNITIEKKQPTGCEDEGYIRYTAKAIYNAVTYTDTYEVVIPATGHNPTEGWKYNALQHYHECSLCDVKLDAADHAMDNGEVTKEATCTEAGEKIYSCDVCEYQKVEAIDAKGHNYVNGICTECGYGTELCTHDNFHTVEVEFKAEDGYCGGVFRYDTCDCGKVSFFNGYELNCHMDYEEELTFDENGYPVFNYDVECEKCGLHLVEADYWHISGDSCSGNYMMSCVITNKSGEVLVDFDGINTVDVEHPNVIYGEVDDLAQYGLCGGTVRKIQCPCGRDEMLLLDFTCDWFEVPDECGEGLYTEICSECGVKKVNEYGSEPLKQCWSKFTDKYTFYKEGKKLVSYEYSFEIEEHNSEFRFELAGTTCSDGYTVYESCKDCGKENSYFEKLPEGEHRQYKQLIDVSAYDLCTDVIEAWVCPCGERSHVSDIYMQHNFEGRDWNTEETENGYVSNGSEVCSDCGLVRNIKNVCTYTGNGCESVFDYVSEYKVGNKTIFTEKNHYNDYSHDLEVLEYKLLGKTCEDGVTMVYECRECGEVITQTNYGHQTFIKERHKTADLGMCAGEIAVYGCACGEYGWIDNMTSCEWNHINYDEKTDTRTLECTKCNTLQVVTGTNEPLDGCQVRRHETTEFIKGVTVVLSFDRTYNTESHNFMTTFEIEEGNKCEDGYNVIYTCKDCGYSHSRFEKPDKGEHWGYRTSEFDMGELGFCEGFIYQFACPCGEVSGVNTENFNCELEMLGSSGTTMNIKCKNCDLTGTITVKDPVVNGCVTSYNTEYTFCNAAGEPVVHYEAVQRMEKHEYVTTFEIEEGNKCWDGYTVIETCTNCGDEHTEYRQSHPDEHVTYYVGSYDLADYGFCGGNINLHACPCGEESSDGWNINEYCDYEWYYDEENDIEYAKCTVCGGSYSEKWTNEEIDACHGRESVEYKFYKPNGELAFAYVSSEIYLNHSDIATFELYNGNCENGYTVTLTCQTCNSVRTYHGEEHELYAVERTDLKELGLCGGELIKARCACGLENDTWSYYECYFNNGSYDESTNTHTAKCQTCGASRVSSTAISEKDSTCTVYVTEYTTIYNAAGKEVVNFSNSYSEKQHNYVYSYNLQGSSCEDGYTITRTCTDCDYSWTDSYVNYGHNTSCVEIIDLSEKGLCGGELRHYRCACGENENWDIWNRQCSFDWYGDGNGMMYATCEECGTRVDEIYVRTPIDGCHTQVDVTVTYSKDDKVIISYETSHREENHNIIYDLVLENPDEGCNGGYTASGTCTTCGDTVAYTGNWHNAYLVEYEELADDGLCAGTTVRKYQCACGEEQRIEDSGEASCMWNYYYASGSEYEWEYDSVSQQSYKCYDCNAVKKVAMVVGEKDDNCLAPAEYIYGYFNSEGTLVYKTSMFGKVWEHDFERTHVEMNDPKDCDAGYSVTETCRDCGETNEWYGNGHYHIDMKYYDLSGYNICDGAQIYEYSCYCGQNAGVSYNLPNCSYTNTWNNYTDENGVLHEEYVTVCEKCGLHILRDTVRTRDEVNCKEIQTTTVVISKGTANIATGTTVSEYESHSTIRKVELVTPGTTCEQGVVITEDCKYCDYKWERTEYWHAETEIVSYDLKDYGSLCGGKLVQYGCACGYYNNVYLDSVECDRYQQQVKYELAYEGQYTTNGWNEFWNDTWLHECAVSDPIPCGFKMLQERHYVWDAANCRMNECYTWKLGYDKENNTCVKEITFVTGFYDYHSYERTVSADGTIVSDICKNCGSSYIEETRYDADRNCTYSSSEAINTLNNGRTKYRYNRSEWAYLNGYQYPEYEYQTYEESYGYVYWWERDYVYDWANFDCTRVVNENNSYGNLNSYEEDCHAGYWHRDTVVEATCTQPGVAQEVCDCVACGNSVVMYDMKIEPGHSWSWYWDGEKEIYTCTRCGLESTQGVDGSIIMEDMTDYTAGTDYIIGYYVRNEVQFYPEVLVLYNGEAIPVEGVVFTELTKEFDGVNAITFDMASTHNLAKATLAEYGYENVTDYVLQIAFVPYSADSDFDYAITLTDESIAK